MKRGLKIYIIFFIIIIFLINIILIFFPKSNLLTGSGITASVSLVIQSETSFISILSPLNTTYNFSIGDNYILDLNVSASFVPDSWWYTLIDLKHNVTVNDSIGFTPNITFNAVRWSNQLIVFAEELGIITNQSVVFFVSVPDSTPILGGVNSSIYVCENDYLSYFFNVTDADEQILTLIISPTNPFYITPLLTTGDITTTIELFSGIMDKEDVGVYEETISATDGVYSHYSYTNITVIEINNKPVVDNIGVQTVWTSGDNSTFYKQVQVTDEEDGNQSSGNLTFSITFLNSGGLFNITDSGIINFTPNSSQVGVYNISVCVNDTGIDNPHPNIFVECGQDGSSIKVCQNFSLTVTNQNRAPTITDYYPDNLSLSVLGTQSLYFNISEYDPDGTVPDAYWYVDNILKEYDSGSLIDEFTYSFGCEVSGTHSIKVNITDGLLNDFLEWSISVGFVECPVVLPPSAGGGGRGALCKEKWACSEWNVCQNTEKSLELGVLSGDDYRIIKEQCLENNFYGELCGIQIRTCIDFNSCNTTYNKYPEIQSCHYTEKPSCYDKIKNCHHRACELLVDCGGPCPPCPTCSDEKRNQGEEGIDCGGPCPWKCKIKISWIKRPEILYPIIIFILILILILIIKIIKIVRYRKKIKEHKIKRFK